jgi:hypothetical protein
MPNSLEQPKYLTDDEKELLEEAKAANPWWFDAVIDCATVMKIRVKKYSGEEDPFTNFKIVARRQGVSTQDVFSFYCDIKRARAEVGVGDYPDESYIDTLRDHSNYSLLWQGYEMRRRDETEG